jgi:hypothetical protein
MFDFPNTQIPENLLELVNDELLDGETIQWIDQPIPVFFSAAAMGTFFFAIPWTAFSLFWTCAAAGVFDPNNGVINLNFDPGRWHFAAFGIPFVLFGLGMLSSPLWMRRNAKRTVYAITDQRAIIVQGTFFAHNITSYYPADMWHVSRKQMANGTGDLYFCFHASEENESSKGQGFMNIRNVREIERMLQELKRTKSTEQG